MKLFNTTQKWSDWWINRKIDWKEHYMNPEHPHRNLISEVLSNFYWLSLIEVGCGAGANLVNIVKHFPNRQLGGIDISKDAIATAEKTLKGALLKVGSGEDIMLSDNSTDVVLSDMCLIYVGMFKIKKYLREMKRIGRNYIILCEFHSTSWWKRLKLKISNGYNAYNWQKLLQKEGFYDIMEIKLTEQDWPGGNPQKEFAYIFIAKIPKRK